MKKTIDTEGLTEEIKKLKALSFFFQEVNGSNDDIQDGYSLLLDSVCKRFDSLIVKSVAGDEMRGA